MLQSGSPPWHSEQKLYLQKEEMQQGEQAKAFLK